MANLIRLGVNIDHVATIRNRAAVCSGSCTRRQAGDRRGATASPRICARIAATSVTTILRVKAEIDKPLNFEMAATEEMTAIALATKPHAVCIVPEKRSERTTEGGLDAAGSRAQLKPVVHALKHAGIRVSLFIAAHKAQIEAAAELGSAVIEIHTGAWCDALAGERAGEAEAEWRLIREGAALAYGFGLEVHAGHGLDYASAETIAALPQIVELNIGHFLIGEAVFEGLSESIKFMRAAMDRGRARVNSL